MPLLFDEQLSSRLPELVADLYPESLHVVAIGLAAAPDVAVWRAAAERGCTLVTKDEDFHRLSVLHGAPPKIIWLRIGNCTTQDVVTLLQGHVDDVRRFVQQNVAAFLELG
ncbi:MAG: hypothetical protein GEU99_20030 [Luteitalea sp.]|nr:hypothetical protein [Luteitalea sp.]